MLSDETITKRSDRNLDLTSTQWSLAEEIVKILEPFDVEPLPYFVVKKNLSNLVHYQLCLDYCST